MLALFSHVNAQSAVSHSKWEENSRSKTASGTQQEPNEFDAAEIAVANKIVTFGGLPDVQKAAWAVVTDANGEQLVEKKISPQNNSIDLRRLSKGEMYFVTIMYKNKSQKGFVVHL